jgi:hypothetical protein
MHLYSSNVPLFNVLESDGQETTRGDNVARPVGDFLTLERGNLGVGVIIER